MELKTILIILVIVFIWVCISLHRSAKRKELATKIADIQDYKPDYQFTDDDGTTSISIDETRKLVCLAELVSLGDCRVRLFPYKDILSLELIQDGHSITKSSRGRPLSSAAVGGLIFGGAGAVVGAIVGQGRDSTTTGKVRRVSLQVVVNDIASPVLTVNFLTSECDEGSFNHDRALKEAHEWAGRLKAVMKAADQSDCENGPFPAELPHATSVADELKKLSELVREGVLTEQEFVLQKNKLLAVVR